MNCFYHLGFLTKPGCKHNASAPNGRTRRMAESVASPELVNPDFVVWVGRIAPVAE